MNELSHPRSWIPGLLCLMGLFGWIGGPARGAPPDPWFTDVTTEVGLDEALGFRVTAADLDGDGYPDLILHIPMDEMVGDVLHKQRVYMNRPGETDDPQDRQFVDFTAQSGIEVNREGTEDGRHSNTALLGDVDNDGDPDLFTPVYNHRNNDLDEGTNELLLNDGTGRFTLAPDSPFHLEEIWNTAAAVFLDYDRDGNLDLFIGDWYVSAKLTYDHLYRGGGDGTFTDVTTQAGLDVVKTCVYAVAAGDYDGDGWTDLFEPSYSHTNSNAKPHLWRNQGDGTFLMVEDETGYSEHGGSGTGKASFGSMPRDYDGDGDLDFLEIYTHGRGDAENWVHSTVVTNEEGVFSWDFYRVYDRGTEDEDLGHHGDHYASWMDFDADGLVDFTLTESGYGNNGLFLFQQGPDHRFSPVTVAAGLDTVNELDLPPHNASPLDYDRDGDLDLIVGFSSAEVPVQLWRNEVGTENHWLVLTLQGNGLPGGANRSAIGARVRVTAGGATQTQEVQAGNGHQCPMVPLDRHFGLGSAMQVDSILVTWPDQAGTTVEYGPVQADQFFTIRQPRSEAPAGIGVRLEMPAAYYSPGDPCRLDAFLHHPGEPTHDQIPLFVLLGLGGEYWFWPGWTQELDYQTVELGDGIFYRSILPEFPWPDTGSSALEGITFYGALLNQAMDAILGDLDGLGQVTFGFGPPPE